LMGKLSMSLSVAYYILAPAFYGLFHISSGEVWYGNGIVETWRALRTTGPGFGPLYSIQQAIMKDFRDTRMVMYAIIYARA
jgi:hypothetical protein